MDDTGFRFGLEAEFILAEAGSLRPLWYRDLSFHKLHGLMAAIPTGDLPAAGLKLERPHTKLMPYVVEGYHLPSPLCEPEDLLPKGVEIRTPLAGSLGECLGYFAVLYDRLKGALAGAGYVPLSLSHHPTADRFHGPQNKRRHDFWMWAMEAMHTYGPDVNVGLPRELAEGLDIADLNAKINYYGPALAALTLNSPFGGGKPWRIRGRTGKALRTYRRSVIAPALEWHPDQAGRLEFKLFEMPLRMEDFEAQFLLWLTLLLDRDLPGRASDASRIYDLGAVAVRGLESPEVRARAKDVLLQGATVLPAWGFDGSPLSLFWGRLAGLRVPADELLEAYEETDSLEGALRLAGQLRGGDRFRPAIESFSAEPVVA